MTSFPEGFLVLVVFDPAITLSMFLEEMASLKFPSRAFIELHQGKTLFKM